MHSPPQVEGQKYECICETQGVKCHWRNRRMALWEQECGHVAGKTYWGRSNSVEFLTREYKLARRWGKGKGDASQREGKAHGPCKSVNTVYLWGPGLGAVTFWG